jgi:hypothetical protein
VDILNSIGSYVTFGLAVAVTLVAGIKLLPIAEVLLTADLPDDSATES